MAADVALQYENLASSLPSWEEMEAQLADMHARDMADLGLQANTFASCPIVPGGFLELLLAPWDGFDMTSPLLKDPSCMPLAAAAPPALGVLGNAADTAFDPAQLVVQHAAQVKMLHGMCLLDVYWHAAHL